MTYRIEPLTVNFEKLTELAKAYQASYCQLSAAYKTQAEMALYTLSYFYSKLDSFTRDRHSNVFMLSENEKPIGFVRFSPIPTAYKGGTVRTAVQKEQGYLDGAAYQWTRKIYFSHPVSLSDRTMILNQLYLSPAIQNKGFGTEILRHTLPIMLDKYDNFIVEYNLKNSRAITFYKTIGVEQIAKTQDLDHIIKNKKYISEVGIGYADIRLACRKIEKKHLQYLSQAPVILNPYQRQYV